MTSTGPAARGRQPLRARLDEPALADARTRTRRRLLLAASVVVAGVLLFTRVWDWWLEREDLSRWDTPLMTWLTQHRDPVLTPVLAGITTITAPTGMSIICAITVALWLWRSHHWWRPLLLAGSMLTAVSCIVGIKWLAERRRPPVADMLLGADLSSSFPSGHTLATTTFVTVVLYLVYFRPRVRAQRIPERDDVPPGAAPPAAGKSPGRWWAVAAGLVVIGVVAFSRLYLGYHWLTDVTGSLCLATAVLGLVMGVDAWRPTARARTAHPRAGAGPRSDR